MPIGYPIYITTIKIQNRKHHKFRINKKWAKRYGFTYYDCQSQDVVIFNDIIYVTQKGYDMIIKSIKKGDIEWLREQMINAYKN